MKTEAPVLRRVHSSLHLLTSLQLLFVVEPDNRHYKNGNHQHTEDNCCTIHNELILKVEYLQVKNYGSVFGCVALQETHLANRLVIYLFKMF